MYSQSKLKNGIVYITIFLHLNTMYSISLYALTTHQYIYLIHVVHITCFFFFLQFSCGLQKFTLLKFTV